MDAIILAEKLESLRRCVNRLETKRAPAIVELRNDVDRQDILALNITRAVQLCVDMAAHILSASEEPAPSSMGQAFDGLEKLGFIDATLRNHLKSAVGFRNVAVHAYQAIDWDIVHAITWQNLEDFKAFARVVCERIHDER